VFLTEHSEVEIRCFDKQRAGLTQAMSVLSSCAVQAAGSENLTMDISGGITWEYLQSDPLD